MANISVFDGIFDSPKRDRRLYIINNYLSLGQWELARSLILSLFRSNYSNNYELPLDVSEEHTELTVSKDSSINSKICCRCQILSCLQSIAAAGPPATFVSSTSVQSSSQLSRLCSDLCYDIIWSLSSFPTILQDDPMSFPLSFRNSKRQSTINHNTYINRFSPFRFPIWTQLRTVCDILISQALLDSALSVEEHVKVSAEALSELRITWCIFMSLGFLRSVTTEAYEAMRIIVPVKELPLMCPFGINDCQVTSSLESYFPGIGFLPSLSLLRLPHSGGTGLPAALSRLPSRVLILSRVPWLCSGQSDIETTPGSVLSSNVSLDPLSQTTLHQLEHLLKFQPLLGCLIFKLFRKTILYALSSISLEELCLEFSVTSPFPLPEMIPTVRKLEDLLGGNSHSVTNVLFRITRLLDELNIIELRSAIVSSNIITKTQDNFKKLHYPIQSDTRLGLDWIALGQALTSHWLLQLYSKQLQLNNIEDATETIETILIEELYHPFLNNRLKRNNELCISHKNLFSENVSSSSSLLFNICSKMSSSQDTTNKHLNEQQHSENTSDHFLIKNLGFTSISVQVFLHVTVATAISSIDITTNYLELLESQRLMKNMMTQQTESLILERIYASTGNDLFDALRFYVKELFHLFSVTVINSTVKKSIVGLSYPTYVSLINIETHSFETNVSNRYQINQSTSSDNGESDIMDSRNELSNQSNEAHVFNYNTKDKQFMQLTQSDDIVSCHQHTIMLEQLENKQLKLWYSILMHLNHTPVWQEDNLIEHKLYASDTDSNIIFLLRLIDRIQTYWVEMKSIQFPLNELISYPFMNELQAVSKDNEDHSTIHHLLKYVKPSIIMADAFWSTFIHPTKTTHWVNSILSAVVSLSTNAQIVESDKGSMSIRSVQEPQLRLNILYKLLTLFPQLIPLALLIIASICKNQQLIFQRQCFKVLWEAYGQITQTDTSARGDIFLEKAVLHRADIFRVAEHIVNETLQYASPAHCTNPKCFLHDTVHSKFMSDLHSNVTSDKLFYQIVLSLETFSVLHSLNLHTPKLLHVLPPDTLYHLALKRGKHDRCISVAFAGFRDVVITLRNIVLLHFRKDLTLEACNDLQIDVDNQVTKIYSHFKAALDRLETHVFPLLHNDIIKVLLLTRLLDLIFLDRNAFSYFYTQLPKNDHDLVDEFNLNTPLQFVIPAGAALHILAFVEKNCISWNDSELNEKCFGFQALQLYIKRVKSIAIGLRKRAELTVKEINETVCRLGCCNDLLSWNDVGLSSYTAVCSPDTLSRYAPPTNQVVAQQSNSFISFCMSSSLGVILRLLRLDDVNAAKNELSTELSSFSHANNLGQLAVAFAALGYSFQNESKTTLSSIEKASNCSQYIKNFLITKQLHMEKLSDYHPIEQTLYISDSLLQIALLLDAGLGIEWKGFDTCVTLLQAALKELNSGPAHGLQCFKMHLSNFIERLLVVLGSTESRPDVNAPPNRLFPLLLYSELAATTDVEPRELQQQFDRLEANRRCEDILEERIALLFGNTANNISGSELLSDLLIIRSQLQEESTIHKTYLLKVVEYICQVITWTFPTSTSSNICEFTIYPFLKYTPTECIRDLIFKMIRFNEALEFCEFIQQDFWSLIANADIQLFSYITNRCNEINYGTNQSSLTESNFSAHFFKQLELQELKYPLFSLTDICCNRPLPFFTMILELEHNQLYKVTQASTHYYNAETYTTDYPVLQRWIDIELKKCDLSIQLDKHFFSDNQWMWDVPRYIVDQVIESTENTTDTRIVNYNVAWTTDVETATNKLFHTFKASFFNNDSTYYKMLSTLTVIRHRLKNEIPQVLQLPIETKLNYMESHIIQSDIIKMIDYSALETLNTDTFILSFNEKLRFLMKSVTKEFLSDDLLYGKDIVCALSDSIKDVFLTCSNQSSLFLLTCFKKIGIQIKILSFFYSLNSLPRLTLFNLLLNMCINDSTMSIDSILYLSYLSRLLDHSSLNTLPPLLSLSQLCICNTLPDLLSYYQNGIIIRPEKDKWFSSIDNLIRLRRLQSELRNADILITVATELLSWCQRERCILKHSPEHLLFALNICMEFGCNNFALNEALLLGCAIIAQFAITKIIYQPSTLCTEATIHPGGHEHPFQRLLQYKQCRKDVLSNQEDAAADVKIPNTSSPSISHHMAQIISENVIKLIKKMVKRYELTKDTILHQLLTLLLHLHTILVELPCRLMVNNTDLYCIQKLMSLEEAERMLWNFSFGIIQTLLNQGFTLNAMHIFNVLYPLRKNIPAQLCRNVWATLVAELTATSNLDAAINVVLDGINDFTSVSEMSSRTTSKLYISDKDIKINKVPSISKNCLDCVHNTQLEQLLLQDSTLQLDLTWALENPRTAPDLEYFEEFLCLSRTESLNRQRNYTILTTLNLENKRKCSSMELSVVCPSPMTMQSGVNSYFHPDRVMDYSLENAGVKAKHVLQNLLCFTLPKTIQDKRFANVLRFLEVSTKGQDSVIIAYMQRGRYTEAVQASVAAGCTEAKIRKALYTVQGICTQTCLNFAFHKGTLVHPIASSLITMRNNLIPSQRYGPSWAVISQHIDAIINFTIQIGAINLLVELYSLTGSLLQEGAMCIELSVTTPEWQTRLSLVRRAAKCLLLSLHTHTLSIDRIHPVETKFQSPKPLATSGQSCVSAEKTNLIIPGTIPKVDTSLGHSSSTESVDDLTYLWTSEFVFGVSSNRNSISLFENITDAQIIHAMHLIKLEIEVLENLPHIPKHYTLLLPFVASFRLKMTEMLLSCGAIATAEKLIDMFQLPFLEIGVNSLMDVQRRQMTLREQGTISANDMHSSLINLTNFLRRRMSTADFNAMTRNLLDIWTPQTNQDVIDTEHPEYHFILALVHSINDTI